MRISDWSSDVFSSDLALRGGGFPQPGAGLLLGYRFPAQMPFAIGHAINRDRQGTAVIVAPGSGHWASTVIQRLTAGVQTATQIVRTEGRWVGTEGVRKGNIRRGLYHKKTKQTR